MFSGLSLALSLYFDLEVARTIEQMNDASWSVRESATKRASCLGYRAIPKLKAAVSNHPSREVRRRCQQAIARWYTVLPSRYRFAQYPQISFFPVPDGLEGCLERERITEPYIRRAIAEVGKDRTKYDLRYATQLLVRDLLDKGTPRCVVQQLIDQMVERERRWWHTCAWDKENIPQGLK